MHMSTCGRFVILETLHLDREVMSSLAAWSALYGVTIQDAVQIAILAFTDALLEQRLAAANEAGGTPS